MAQLSTIHQASSLVIYAKDKDKVSDFYKKSPQFGDSRIRNGVYLASSWKFRDRHCSLAQFLANEIVISSPPKLREDTPIKDSLFTVQSIEQAQAEAIDAGGQLKNNRICVSARMAWSTTVGWMGS